MALLDGKVALITGTAGGQGRVACEVFTREGAKVIACDIDVEGNEVRFKAEGFLARVIQHEIDHTNGIVFIDHIKDEKDAFYRLDDKGELQPLSYDEHIDNNSILWD